MAYEVALGLSIDIKEYESKWRRKRNDKISAGLPQPPVYAEEYLSPKTRREKMNKFDSSKNRFQNHFIGMSIDVWNKKQNLTPDEIVKLKSNKPVKNDSGVAFFDGALNAMGLATFEAKKLGERKGKLEYEIKIGLTPLGVKFYRKRNPVLVSYERERGNQKTALSKEESGFLREEIILKFSLEKMFISLTARNENIGKITNIRIDI